MCAYSLPISENDQAALATFYPPSWMAASTTSVPAILPPAEVELAQEPLEAVTKVEEAPFEVLPGVAYIKLE